MKAESLVARVSWDHQTINWKWILGWSDYQTIGENWKGKEDKIMNLK
jgi:hypothetical protein